jgi:hypothetical protein
MAGASVFSGMYVHAVIVAGTVPVFRKQTGFKSPPPAELVDEILTKGVGSTGEDWFSTSFEVGSALMILLIKSSMSFLFPISQPTLPKRIRHAVSRVLMKRESGLDGIYFDMRTSWQAIFTILCQSHYKRCRYVIFMMGILHLLEV